MTCSSPSCSQPSPSPRRRLPAVVFATVALDPAVASPSPSCSWPSSPSILYLSDGAAREQSEGAGISHPCLNALTVAGRQRMMRSMAQGQKRRAASSTKGELSRAIPARVRDQLLSEARGRCCLHRLTWVRRYRVSEDARKTEALEVHHVRFRSCGGKHDLDNLVPLCPSCHSMVHDGHRRGEPFVTDNELRAHWTLWRQLRSLVPNEHAIGRGSPSMWVTIAMDLYGLETRFGINEAVSYSEARTIILGQTVGVLRAADPHFPFPPRPEATAWNCHRMPGLHQGHGTSRGLSTSLRM